MCAIGSYSVPVIGSCPSSFILLIKTTTRTKLRRRKNEAHTFPPRGLMPTLGLSVCFCSDSASGREWNQTQEATRKYGILRIHMYGWHSSIFMNNLWGIMAAATFCEQRGEKRDWNLNRIDAPHPIITPLNSCLSDITRGILFDGKDVAGGVNIKRQNGAKYKIQIKQNFLWQIFTASKWRNCNIHKYASKVAVAVKPGTDLTKICSQNCYINRKHTCAAFCAGHL